MESQEPAVAVAREPRRQRGRHPSGTRSRRSHVYCSRALNQLPDVLRLVSFSLVSLSLLVGASWVSRTGGVPRRTPGARERDTRARERHQATTNGKYTEPFFASSLFRSFALSLFRSFAACCSLYRPQAIDAYFNHPQALDSYLNHHQVIDSYLNLHQVIDSYLNHHQVIDSYLNHHQAIDSYLNQAFTRWRNPSAHPLPRSLVHRRSPR